jgi:spore maturation protein SpmB
MVSVIQGSSETTLYVLAVYFGAVGVHRTRHALPAALCGETAGLIAAVTVCNFWF